MKPSRFCLVTFVLFSAGLQSGNADTIISGSLSPTAASTSDYYFAYYGQSAAPFTVTTFIQDLGPVAANQTLQFSFPLNIPFNDPVQLVTFLAAGSDGGVIVGLTPSIVPGIIANKSPYTFVTGDTSETAFAQALQGGGTTATTAVDLFIQAARQAYPPIQGSQVYDFPSLTGPNQSVSSTLVAFSDPTSAGAASVQFGFGTVPEPSTLTLLGITGAVVAGRGLWRRACPGRRLDRRTA
jgi:hypothetical protein